MDKRKIRRYKDIHVVWNPLMAARAYIVGTRKEETTEVVLATVEESTAEVRYFPEAAQYDYGVNEVIQQEVERFQKRHNITLPNPAELLVYTVAEDVHSFSAILPTTEKFKIARKVVEMYQCSDYATDPVPAYCSFWAWYDVNAGKINDLTAKMAYEYLDAAKMAYEYLDTIRKGGD